jgi:uncharacterized protein (TIGR00270 family)
MNCDMCGQESRLFPTAIENSTLNVCISCSKYGARIKTKFVKKQIRDIPETLTVFSEGFSDKIRHSREAKGLNQKELAAQLAIKESLLHNIESGKHNPDNNLTKRIESFLNIKLTEEIKDVEISTEKSSGVTIGDLIKKS